MARRALLSAQDEIEDKLRAAFYEQLRHLGWHGETPDHWHVGITALDHGSTNTENVQRLFDYPVHRVCELPRDTLVLVSRQLSSCHQRGPSVP